MSIIHINQIETKINEIFSSVIDATDIGANDPERNAKINTRCLAAYGVYSSIGCTVEEAAYSVVDGGDDNGIDAIYYSEQSRTMIIVQSKFSRSGTGEPDSASVHKFCKGVKDLFNIDFERFNNKIKKRAKIIENALKGYDTKYQLTIIDTYLQKDLAEHSSRLISDLLLEMNNTGDEESEHLVKFSRLNQSKVHSSLALSAGNDPIDIELGLTQWGAVNEPYKAYYGMVAAKEVAEWWNNYNNRLFVRNIRQVLGSTDINEEIDKTIKENPQLFWYFNNGITIIADKIEKSIVGGGNRDLGAFKLTNIAIVNGAQTVSTIGKFATTNPNSNNLDNVKINIRMIQLSDTPEGFGKEVTKTNNRQNRIENRDFVSQDDVQMRIKSELAIDGIEYSIVRSENYESSEKSFELIESTIALACASGKTNLAVLAKSAIGKFYEDLDKGIYREIFNNGISGYYVYNCVKVVRFIEKILKDEIDSLERHSGRKYGLLIHGNRLIELLVIKSLNIKQQLNVINFEINEDALRQGVNDTTGKMLKIIQENYPDNFLATLFKNITKCNTIVDLIAK